MHPRALIAGRYRLHHLIGAGAMGQVWRATDERLRRDVAVKVVDLGQATGPVTADRFQREVLATARLNHPTIVTTFDGGADGDVAYLVMELLDGVSLATRLRGGPLGVGEAVRVAGQVARACEATHLIGIVHRDIKPGNVMLTTGGQVKVLDFGIARLVTETATEHATVDALGTAAYMSPEQAMGRPVGPASDVYSLGCLLFAMLAGRPPFPGTNSLVVAQAQVSAEPPRLASVRPDVPPALDALVAAMLAKDPAGRPSARQVAEALAGLALGLVPDAAAPTVLLPPQTAVLPPQTAVLPPQTAVLPPQTALLPPQTAMPQAAQPLGSARVSLAGPDGGSTRPASGRRPSFGRAAKGLLLAMVALLVVWGVWLGGSRVATLLPTANKTPTTKATATTKPTPKPTAASSRPTISLPTLPTLPGLPSAGEAALRAALSGVDTALDAWSPADKTAQKAKESLQREWARASARIVAGQNADSQLAAVTATVEKLHDAGTLPPGPYAGLSLALRAVAALM